MLQTLKKFLSTILPGIFILGFNIGTGSVTAMAKAGASYGMSLLWTVLISCMITFVMLVSYDRLTLVTGETALFAFRKYIHPFVGIFFIIALTTAVCGSIIGVMGIVADICSEWSKMYLADGIDATYFALFFILLVYTIFLTGRTKYFQKILALLVALMALAFLINFFLLTPPASAILKGLIPAIPDNVDTRGRGPFLVIASMVGTTVFSGLFIIRTTLVKEAGWGLSDTRIQRRDALLSVLMMFLISTTIMAAAAGTLYVNNLGLKNAIEMITLLEPLAGRFAVAIFATGIIAAGVSSQFPNILMLPWLLCDYRQTKRDMTLPFYRIIVFIISFLGLIVPVFEAPPVLVMIASQVFSALILPVTVICISYLGNQKKIMHRFVFSTGHNLTLILIFIFSCFMSFIGLRGIWETIRALL